MKTFACGAVVPGCTFTVAAQTDEELLHEVARHAAEDHGIATPRPPGPPTLLLGYARMSEPALQAGIRELADAVRATR